jgi:hypothetical protein
MSEFDLSPLPNDATEADRNARVNALITAVRPFTRFIGQNGVSIHVSQGNVIAEINTKEIASIIQSASATDSGGATSGNATTGNDTNGISDPNDPGETFTPGDANTPGASVAYEARLRSGTASLVGYAEFASPSTPAKKYRTITASGTQSQNRYLAGSSCGIPEGIPVSSGFLSGNINYDVATGAPSGTMTYTGTVGVIGTTDVSSMTTLPAPSVGEYTVNNTPTTSTATINSGCFATSIEFQYTELSFKTELTNEDTDVNAITRWRAATSFGSWGSATFPAASAAYNARTTGFTFTYEEAEFRATYTGLPAAWLFKAKVRVVRVNQATSAVSTVSTLVFNVTTDGSGGATFTVSVIPLGNSSGAVVYDPGYTYRVQSITHYL